MVAGTTAAYEVTMKHDGTLPKRAVALLCVGSLKVISFVAAAGWQLLRSWTLLESAPRKGGADVPRCLLIAEFDVFALLMIWRESLRTVIAGQPTAERQAYKIWSGARSPGFAT